MPQRLLPRSTSGKPTSQEGALVMDPFYSYASQNDDNNPEGPEDPRMRAIVVEEPRSERHIEFNVQTDAISAVSPYIKTMFDIYPTKRRLGISATADHMQILLKYMKTHTFDPTDISHRHRNKHDIVFRHIDFYLFCQKMGYKSLADVVRIGIQASLELLAWSPAPGEKDSVLLYPNEGSNGKPSHAPLLKSLISACELYYPKIKRGDPIKRSLLIYSYHLWPSFELYFSNRRPSIHHQAREISELWAAMNEYHIKTPDIYKSEAPEYSIRTNFVLWMLGVPTFEMITVASLACCYFVYRSKSK
ncbi:hypothetical protein BJ912DRAFT_965885 [Pholiota molesta]|nr:hypothetical protein BJ912DRAFT_965885 [Pholiota molesta]